MSALLYCGDVYIVRGIEILVTSVRLKVK
jgi:hypothetical protein